MNKTKTVLLGAAMYLVVGGASAEISTVVKSATGNVAQPIKDTPCYVREPSFFGNGGFSPLSSLFADAGLNVVNDASAACQIDYRGFVNVKINPSSVLTLPADWIVQNQEEITDVEAAIHGDISSATDKIVSDASKVGKHNSAVGETAGASVGSMLGLGGAVGGALLGSLIDGATSKNVEVTAGVGHIKVELVIKSAGVKPARLEIDVYSASTTKERPVDLLRAAVRRVVSEIQTKEVASRKTETANSNTPANVATTSTHEVQK